MADYISSQNGNWNDAATWGGGGYPSSAGDTAAIGHEVTYNVSSATQLGQITVNNGGVFTFSRTASTKLTLGHQDIRINNGGELRIGRAGEVIPASYIAELVWATAADNEKGIYIEAGGKLNIYGDPAYYGSNDIAALAADWTAGQTFTVIGDYTSLWQAGQPLTVHRGTDYSAYNTDTAIVSIASMALNGGNTDITIVQVFPGGTFYASGRVTNVGRNVKLYKNGVSAAMGNYNTNRPRILDDSSILQSNCIISDASFTGFYNINARYNFKFLASVFRNGRACIESSGGINIAVTDSRIYSCTYGLTGTAMACQSTGTDIYACYNGIAAFYETGVDGHIYGNYIGLYGTTLTNVTGYIYANDFGVAGGTGIMMSGAFAYDQDDNEKNNTYDIYVLNDSFTEIKMRGAKMPVTSPTIGNRNNFRAKISISSENHHRELGAHRRYKQYGDIIRNTSVVRLGGADNSVEAVPSSNCGGATPLSILEWVEFDVPAAAQTRSVYIRGSGWSAFPESARLYFEASYLDDAVTLLEASIKSTEVLSANDVWTKFTVTFTPAVAGPVRYVVSLSKYEPGAKAYVDNQLG